MADDVKEPNANQGDAVTDTAIRTLEYEAGMRDQELAELRLRVVQLESAAGFVVRRAHLATNERLRERLEVLGKVLDGAPVECVNCGVSSDDPRGLACPSGAGPQHDWEERPPTQEEIIEAAYLALEDHVGTERVIGFDPVHGETRETIPLRECIDRLIVDSLVYRGALEKCIKSLLDSARPHPVEHPTMWRAWRKAEELLCIPKEESRVIPTSDERLEAKLLAEPSEPNDEQWTEA
jgi:hypothetical protein